MIATIPLATGNKLNCFISARGMLAIVWHCVLFCCCSFSCVFFVDFYMLINHLLKQKNPNLAFSNDISDHKMIFTFIENIACVKKFGKLVKIEQMGEVAIQKFIEELKSMKIFDELNQNINDSPEDHYNKFASLLNHAREKHLPIKLVKGTKNFAG